MEHLEVPIDSKAEKCLESKHLSVLATNDLATADSNGTSLVSINDPIYRNQSVREEDTNTTADDETETTVRTSIESRGPFTKRFLAEKLKQMVPFDTDLVKRLDGIAQEGDGLTEPEDPDGSRVELEVRGWGWTLESLEARRKRSGVRANQAQAYTRLVEDRLTELESKVRRLLKEPTPTLDNDDMTIPTNLITAESLTWPEFNSRIEIDTRKVARWIHRPEVDLAPRSIIEVLREEPRYMWGEIRSRNYNLVGVTNSNPLEVMDAVRVEFPYRIRIRSSILLKTIEELTGSRTTVGQHRHRLLFYPPFKLLATYHPELTEGLKSLEAKHEKIGQGTQKRVQ